MALIEPLEYVPSRLTYVSFGPPRPATDSDFSDDDIIVRYNGEEIIGYTILHASKRATTVTP